jgi:hypothetical protein
LCKNCNFEINAVYPDEADARTTEKSEGISRIQMQRKFLMQLLLNEFIQLCINDSLGNVEKEVII